LTFLFFYVIIYPEKRKGDKKMKIINKPALSLTDEEKALLLKVIELFEEIEKKDTNGDLTDLILNYREVGNFNDLATLIDEIVVSAEENE